MGEYTPGPWLIDGRMITPKYGVTVALLCEFDSFGGVHDAPNAKANGDLISAAPDLLSALRMLVANINEFGAVTDAEFIDQAEAAIAKATGQRP